MIPERPPFSIPSLAPLCAIAAVAAGAVWALRRLRKLADEKPATPATIRCRVRVDSEGQGGVQHSLPRMALLHRADEALPYVLDEA
ncbi:MAG: hypothetical protein ACYC8T_37230 [Myxococcaceae bacterium]